MDYLPTVHMAMSSPARSSLLDLPNSDVGHFPRLSPSQRGDVDTGVSSCFASPTRSLLLDAVTTWMTILRRESCPDGSFVPAAKGLLATRVVQRRKACNTSAGFVRISKGIKSLNTSLKSNVENC